jgi:hypothetical protein
VHPGVPRHAESRRCDAGEPDDDPHGEQRIELHAPIPTEGTITTTPTIKAMYDKGKGALVVVETESVDEKGRLLFRNTSGIFARGEGGFGGDRGPSGVKNVVPDRKPDNPSRSRRVPTRRSSIVSPAT